MKDMEDGQERKMQMSVWESGGEAAKWCGTTDFCSNKNDLLEGGGGGEEEEGGAGDIETFHFKCLLSLGYL